MTKVEVFHCAACSVYLSTSASVVHSHLTSQEHLSNTKVTPSLLLGKRCYCYSSCTLSGFANFRNCHASKDFSVEVRGAD